MPRSLAAQLLNKKLSTQDKRVPFYPVPTTPEACRESSTTFGCEILPMPAGTYSPRPKYCIAVDHKLTSALGGETHYGLFLKESIVVEPSEICSLGEYLGERIPDHTSDEEDRDNSYLASPEGDTCIDARLQGSVMRFINHSENANCEFQFKDSRMFIVLLPGSYKAGTQLMGHYGEMLPCHSMKENICFINPSDSVLPPELIIREHKMRGASCTERSLRPLTNWLAIQSHPAHSEATHYLIPSSSLLILKGKLPNNELLTQEANVPLFTSATSEPTDLLTYDKQVFFTPIICAVIANNLPAFKALLSIEQCDVSYMDSTNGHHVVFHVINHPTMSTSEKLAYFGALAEAGHQSLFWLQCRGDITPTIACIDSDQTELATWMLRLPIDITQDGARHRVGIYYEAIHTTSYHRGKLISLDFLSVAILNHNEAIIKLSVEMISTRILELLTESLASTGRIVIATLAKEMRSATDHAFLEKLKVIIKEVPTTSAHHAKLKRVIELKISHVIKPKIKSPARSTASLFRRTKATTRLQTKARHPRKALAKTITLFDPSIKKKPPTTPKSTEKKACKKRGRSPAERPRQKARLI